MAVAKKEQQAAEQEIHQLRHEASTAAIHHWLVLREAELNRNWPDMAGEALTAMQGEARVVLRLKRIIEQGPTIKSDERSE
jgi:hypothetical protein